MKTAETLTDYILDKSGIGQRYEDAVKELEGLENELTMQAYSLDKLKEAKYEPVIADYDEELEKIFALEPIIFYHEPNDYEFHIIFNGKRDRWQFTLASGHMYSKRGTPEKESGDYTYTNFVEIKDDLLDDGQIAAVIEKVITDQNDAIRPFSKFVTTRPLNRSIIHTTFCVLRASIAAKRILDKISCAEKEVKKMQERVGFTRREVESIKLVESATQNFRTWLYNELLEVVGYIEKLPGVKKLVSISAERSNAIMRPYSFVRTPQSSVLIYAVSWRRKCTTHFRISPW
ncbi:MAG: hypothetical protein LBC95_03335 [Candidatus Nomurabacteria bacterium]|nr:hypothetical protein [Candidatus Nomurabacteria bacterium]